MRMLPRILSIVVAGLLLCASASAGVSYLDPIGGWTYTYTGDLATAGPGAFDSLDGTWDHDNGMDQWDGSQVGMGRPGGVSALAETGTNFVRLQDTGDPRDYGMGDPGSNRKLMFGHSITSEIGAAANTILDAGVTLSFRARLSTSAPLDDVHPDGGGGITPWPAGGDGYVTHDGGMGNFGIRQSDGKSIAFALALTSDNVELNNSGLVMNKLNGTSPTNDVDILGKNEVALESEGYRRPGELVGRRRPAVPGVVVAEIWVVGQGNLVVVHHRLDHVGSELALAETQVPGPHRSRRGPEGVLETEALRYGVSRASHHPRAAVLESSPAHRVVRR